MRSPVASTTSGTEAVLISIILVWMGTFSFRARCGRGAAAVEHFESLMDADVGKAILAHDPLWPEFRDWVLANPLLCEVLRIGGGSVFRNAFGGPLESSDPRLQAIAEDEFHRTIATEVAVAAKQSDWWKANLKAIKSHQRKVKQVRSVLES